jgi:putative copper resistance protein D
MDGILIAARFGLYADLALLMGLPLFWLSMGEKDGDGRRLMLAALAVGGLLLSVFWLLASVAAMAGTSFAPPDWAMVWMLLGMTPLGWIMGLRVGALALLLLLLAGRRSIALSLLPASLAAATLAWAGHAGATEGSIGTIHRVTDVLHIWAAAGWFGALVALLHSVFVRPSQVNMASMAAKLARFSMLGSIFVATLLITGAVNGLMIVGAANLPKLLGSTYGLLLGAKLLLFAAMLGLAACNRWWLTPALDRAVREGALTSPVAKLRLSLLFEMLAAVAILMLVAMLGTLDPVA